MTNVKSKLAIFSILSGALLFSALTVSAQVVDTPEGTVEFIGLEEWTVEKIKAVMKEKAPGQPLGMCAAVLVENVGFASASAKGVGNVEGKDYTVVTVVEPQKANVLKNKPEPADVLPDDEKWAVWFTATTAESDILARLRGIKFEMIKPLVLDIWKAITEHIKPAWRCGSSRTFRLTS